MDWDSWFWIAVVVVVAISKALGKLKEGSESQDQPARPVRRRSRSIQRTVRPRTPMRPATPPVIGQAKPRQWNVAADDLRQFLDRLQQGPPPVRPEPRPVPAPAPVKPKRVAPKPAEKPVPAAAPKATTSRAAQWAAAFRDRQNLRNIIVATEIIGPPKAERL